MRVRRTVYFNNNRMMILYQLMNDKDFLLNEEDLPEFIGNIINDLYFIPDICSECTDKGERIFLYKKAGFLKPEGIAIREGNEIVLVSQNSDLEIEREKLAEDNIRVLPYEDAVQYTDAITQLLINCIDEVHGKVNKYMGRVYKVGSKLTDPREFKVLMENIVGGE